MNRQTKRTVPTFAAEADEAAWWYKSRAHHDRELIASAESDEAKVLTKHDLLRRLQASKKTPKSQETSVPPSK